MNFSIPHPLTYLNGMSGAVLASMLMLTPQAHAQAESTDVAAEASATRERLTDFDDAEANARWMTVLDNVMGGRSDGAVDFADGVMRFTGDINTNGGGFASIRWMIEPGTLAEAERVVLRVRLPEDLPPRGPFRLLVIDDLHTLPRDDPNRRPRSILHRYDLPLDPALKGQWQTVEVELDAMTPTFHGDPVNAKPLDPSRAVQMGFILNDTTDGPFALDVDWIDITQPE